MRQGGSRRRGFVEREPVLLVGENVLDRAIAVGAEPLGARTGGVEPVQPVDPAQPHEPETRAIALLGMRAAFEDAGDERRCCMNTLWGWGRVSWAGCGPDVRRGGHPEIDANHGIFGR